MSQKNVELARRAMESAETFYELLDEYVVCDFRDYPLPDAAEVEFGRQAVIDMFRRFWGTFEDYEIDTEDILDVGASVIVVVTDRGRGKGSGVPLERHFAWLWTFRKGRLIRIEPHRTKESALEAAGLSE